MDKADLELLHRIITSDRLSLKGSEATSIAILAQKLANALKEIEANGDSPDSAE